MSDSELYRDKYFEEKIIGLGKLIKANFINVDNKLEDIDNEVKKINSRISTFCYKYIKCHVYAGKNVTFQF